MGFSPDRTGVPLLMDDKNSVKSSTYTATFDKESSSDNRSTAKDLRIISSS
jgi:hypothetical protein